MVVLVLLFIVRPIRDWMAQNKDALQAISSLAAVLAVVIAVISYLDTAMQQQETAQVQAEAAATNSLQEQSPTRHRIL